MKKTNFIFIFLSLIICISTSCKTNHDPSISYLPIILYGDETQALHILDVENGDIFATDAKNVNRFSLFYGDWALISAETEDGVEYYNYVNTHGNYLNNAHYKFATIMNDDRAWVVLPGECITLIDSKGNTVASDKEWLQAYPFNDGISVVKHAHKGWIAVDKFGKEVDSMPYKYPLPLVADNILPVIDEDGKGHTVYTIHTLQTGKANILYDEVEFGTNNSYKNYLMGINEDRIIVSKDDRYGVVNKKGEWLINPQFASMIYDGEYYMYKKEDKWAWCTFEGQYLMNPKYASIKGFNGNKLAPAFDEETNDWGYVDVAGEWVINPQFKDANSFNNNGLAMAKLGKEWGIIGDDGKWIVNPQYEEIYELQGYDNYIVSTGRGAYILINSKGETLSKIPFVINTNLVTDDGQFNIYNLSDFKYIESDYIDFDLLAQELISMVNSMTKTTSGALKNKLGTSCTFRDGEVFIDLVESKYFDLRLKAYCNPWIKEYYDWWYYETVFNSNVSVSRYKMLLELKDSAMDNYDELIKYLSDKFQYDAGNEYITIEGKQFKITTECANSVIVFDMK